MSLKLRKSPLYETIKANRLLPWEFERVTLLHPEITANEHNNFYQTAGFLRMGNDISKLKWRRKQSYSQRGDNPGDTREVLLVAAHRSQQTWVSAPLWAPRLCAGNAGWGSRRRSVQPPAAALRLQTCSSSATLPLFLRGCRDAFPAPPS